MKIRSIELLRGAAALSVAVAHSDAQIGGNAELPFGRWHSYAMPGTAGVEFFFVLSGFVMAVAHRTDIARGGHIGWFLWKRFCRIYPLYWLVLAIPIHQFWGAPSVNAESVLTWMSLLPLRPDNLLVVAWTLRQEVTFYLVLALCLLPGIGRSVLLAWVALTTLFWFVVPAPAMTGTPALVFSHLFSLFNFEFFAGLGAGWLLSRLPAAGGRGWGVLAVGVVALAWRMSLDGWGVEYGPVHARPIYGAAYASIILGCAMLERAGVWRFGTRASAFAGVAGAISYPLYLVHVPVLDIVAHGLGPSGMAARIGPDATFCVFVGAAVVAGGLLAMLVDQPLQRALRRVSAGSRSSKPVPG